MIAPATFTHVPAPRAGDTPIRVVHALLSLDVGGFERVVISLADQGRQLGHEVFILCIDHPGSLYKAAQDVGAQIMCAQKGPGLRPGVISRIAERFDNIRPHVVHSHQIGALLYAGLAARRAKVPAIVHTEHGKHYSNRWRTRWLGKIAARTAHRFFCVSADIAKDVARHRIAKPDEIAVISNGIDISAFEGIDDRNETRANLGIPPSARVVGTVGRLSAIKRQDILINAFATLRTRVPDLRLLLIGAGDMEQQLKQQARGLGIDSYVHFAGYQSNPAPFLRAMDLFAITSESEGMPLAVLEAWATRLPVVASHVGGLPELIEHERTGLLYDFSDTNMLVDSLARLLNNDPERNRMGHAGCRLVKDQFTLAQTTENYDAAYRLLIGGQSLRQR